MWVDEGGTAHPRFAASRVAAHSPSLQLWVSTRVIVAVATELTANLLLGAPTVANTAMRFWPLSSGLAYPRVLHRMGCCSSCSRSRSLLRCFSSPAGRAAL